MAPKAGKKSEAREFAALIGDVVGSRQYQKRSALQGALRGALKKTNDIISGIQPLSPTIGDEFQGLYSDLASAVSAALLIRLHLFAKGDVRFGIGWGPLEVFHPSRVPFEQDGPAWWAAREAVNFVAQASKQKETPRGWRTACQISEAASIRRKTSATATRQLRLFQNLDPEAGPDLASGIGLYINSFLLCRDELVYGMTERDARILLALLSGQRQADIARREGITQSAVSQRIARSGVYAMLQTHNALLNGTQWNLLVFG